MEIGFIGLGNMGRGMAANLLKAGHHVSVYNRSRPKRKPLSRRERPPRTIAEARGGAVVFTMLADDQAVENVTFGDGGIVASLKRGATHVSSSTISVAMSQRLAAAHAEAGQQYAAAPVFGRPEAASAAKLFVIVDRLQICRHPHLDAVRRSGVSDLWRADRATGIRAGRVRRDPGPQGHPAGAGGHRTAARAAAGRRPAARPLTHPAGNRWLATGLVGGRYPRRPGSRQRFYISLRPLRVGRRRRTPVPASRSSPARVAASGHRRR